MTLQHDKPIAEIDHLLTYVANVEAAAETYSSLGFTVTPASHIEPMGIVNRLVLLTPMTEGAANFIELMGVADRARLPETMAGLLAGDEGIRSMVMWTANARRAHAALVGDGLAFAPPVHVRREWRLSETESVYPEFDVLLPAAAPLVFNACQYHNVELYLQPAWRRHANTAESIDRVFAVTTDPDALAQRYGALFRSDVIVNARQCVAVSPGKVALELMTPDCFADRFGEHPPPISNGNAAAYAGFGIRVADFEACLAELRRSQHPWRKRNRTACAAVCGNLVQFTQAPRG